MEKFIVQKNRYALLRSWDESKPVPMYI